MTTPETTHSYVITGEMTGAHNVFGFLEGDRVE